MNTTETKLNIRIDKKTKESAKKTLNSLGLDLSSGVKLFLHSVINTQSIPFKIRTKNGYTYDEENRILKESKEAMRKHTNDKKSGYKSIDEMFKSLA